MLSLTSIATRYSTYRQHRQCCHASQRAAGNRGTGTEEDFIAAYRSLHTSVAVEQLSSERLAPCSSRSYTVLGGYRYMLVVPRPQPQMDRVASVSPSAVVTVPASNSVSSRKCFEGVA